MDLPSPVAAALNRVPLPLAGIVAQQLFSMMLRRHPQLFARLGDAARKRFAFCPAELDLAFTVEFARRRVGVSRRRGRGPADASVSGPFFLLLALLEGRVDGDAIFFSRALTVTGDMEAVLALRHAIEDCDFDLASEIGGLAGPLAPLGQHLLRRLRTRVLGA